jgi:sn-glycerol 3-phosphate transport system ATP-binding protein
MSMADQVVLLNQGRVEQAGTPRALYARPATTFAARFIGTPPMNLAALETDGRIAGSDVVSGVGSPAGTGAAAATLGVRPESIVIDTAGHAARVESAEYLGADLVLRCAIGNQILLVRTEGQQRVETGQQIGLRWRAEDAHGFTADGRRID